MTLTLNVSLDVVDDAGDREYQGFLEVLQEVYSLQGMRIPIEEVIKALCTQQQQEYLAAVTDYMVTPNVLQHLVTMV